MKRHKEFRFSLEKLRNVDIRSITIRETDGHDEDAAALTAKAKGGGSTLLDELIRVSIVAVDDRPVDQPFGAIDEWSSRTRSFVARAWRSLNAIEDGELPDFLSSGVPLAASSSPASGGNATGASGFASPGTSAEI